MGSLDEFRPRPRPAGILAVPSRTEVRVAVSADAVSAAIPGTKLVCEIGTVPKEHQVSHAAFYGRSVCAPSHLPDCSGRSTIQKCSIFRSALPHKANGWADERKIARLREEPVFAQATTDSVTGA